MKITILGAGAIGGVLGACLTRGGCDVELIDIDENHIAALKKRGMTTITPDGKWSVPVHAYTVHEYLEHPHSSLECVLLSVKTQYTTDALKPFLPLLGPDSFVVSVQNGLSEYEIADLIGKERTVGSFVNIFSDYIDPGVINYGGKGALVIGEIDGSITPRLHTLEKELKGLDRLEISDNIFGFLWGKLGYATILTATALTNETMADIFANHKYRTMLMNLASEILEVATKEGISLPIFDDWNPSDAYPREHRNLEQMNKQLDIHVKRLRTYTKVHSGIWRDIAIRHRRSEMHEQLQLPIQIGSKYGLSLPLTCMVLDMLTEIECGTRNFSLDNLDLLLEQNNIIYGN